MNIYDLKKMSPEERKDFLEAHSEEIKDQIYMKPLSEVEMQIQHQEFAQVALERDLIAEELVEYKKNHKSRLEPLQRRASEALGAIRNKAKAVTGRTYKIPDFDNQMIHFVADDGTVVNSRGMLPEERQFHISHQISKAAN